MRSKTEEFIFNYEAFSFLVIQSKDHGNQQTLSFYLKDQTKWCRTVKIFVDSQVISYRVNQNEERSKLKNLFWNLIVQFRKAIDKVSIHWPNDIKVGRIF